jgi:hypothetical protein
MILTSDYKRVMVEWMLPILDSIINDYTDKLMALWSNVAREGQRDPVWRRN